MTDFQMSLIAAGGVFVVGVITYNKWQEYKARKSVERAFASDHDDVLMRDGEQVPAVDRHEPVFEADLQDNAPVAAKEPVLDADAFVPADVKPEPQLDTPAPAATPAPAPAPAPAAPAAPVMPTATAPTTTYRAPGASAAQDAVAASLPGTRPGMPPAELAECLVDPLIDCLIPLSLETPVRGDKILPTLQTLRRVGNKPIHYIGFAVSGEWEPIVHGGVYTKLQAGVQMATRTTALNELEYSELVTRLRAVADEIGAEPEVPDMIEVMAEARILHRFVAGHDAQLGVNLAANGAPWAMSTLIGALENAGFDVRPDGRFAMPDKESTGGGVLFTLSTNVTLGADTTSRLTLLLDVPCVAPGRDGFGRMVDTARGLTQRLDATIVDDFDQPLVDEALDEIKSQVGEFYQEMDAADIPAGSTRALRLFS
ncbi:cell division protein ZipA C-terminal FtsZ-binding domain-containing protein [Massilia sp. CFBP9026]|uniref:cell division protein ZipA C-terminal FtsZ-binding domain-containing protein n=1 Tax=Massilia sp. CFBP9026 TaxID=3096536 RepID=UPI002A6AED32|nr:cell division protein ZipA C-terminal FtsZ-binding domain-containing protein [Massilia sp. CFBP9026]MDY0960943.1 cell division protein ZipA C-terminal FtsZ-binding domain-containing protein [Massilia sp. CFBP9026]